MISGGDKVSPVVQKLIAGATLADPNNEIPPFSIDETEVTQEAFFAYEAERAQSKYELVQTHCDGTVATDVRNTLEEVLASPMNIPVDGRNICGIEIRRQTPVTSSDRPAIEGKFAGPKKPMIYVSFDDARGYCLWRGGDLPTGAQWGKAARYNGDYATASGELKPNEANYWHEGSAQAPVDVKSFLPNGHGVYEMTGNVWEWTLDQAAFGTRVLRGGSWNYVNSWFLRAVNYHVSVDDGHVVNPGDRGTDVGFRCVSPPRTPKK